jgi:hypothetical protein
MVILYVDWFGLVPVAGMLSLITWIRKLRGVKPDPRFSYYGVPTIFTRAYWKWREPRRAAYKADPRPWWKKRAESVFNPARLPRFVFGFSGLIFWGVYAWIHRFGG